MAEGPACTNSTALRASSPSTVVLQLNSTCHRSCTSRERCATYASSSSSMKRTGGRSLARKLLRRMNSPYACPNVPAGRLWAYCRVASCCHTFVPALRSVHTASVDLLLLSHCGTLMHIGRHMQASPGQSLCICGKLGDLECHLAQIATCIAPRQAHNTLGW